MENELIIMSDKGMVLIPKKIRSLVPSDAFTIRIENGEIILSPVKEVEGALASFDGGQE
jgi:hypothetical protein